MHLPSDSYLGRTEYTKRWQFHVLESSRGGQATGGSPLPDVCRNGEISLQNQPYTNILCGSEGEALKRRLQPSITSCT